MTHLFQITPASVNLDLLVKSVKLTLMNVCPIHVNILARIPKDHSNVIVMMAIN